MLFSPILALMFWTALVHSKNETISHTDRTSNPWNNIPSPLIGGFDAPDGDYPWAVLIRGFNRESRKYDHCGATIISKRWMISAAHCFNGKKVICSASGNQYDIQIEIPTSHSEFIQDTGLLKWMTSVKGRTHSRGKSYDIALIELESPIQPYGGKSSIAKLPPVSITNEWPPINSLCTVVGWGCLENNGHRSKIAQMLTLDIISNHVCKGIYNYDPHLNANHEFCAHNHEFNAAICDGDSGSGLIYIYKGQPVIVGVAVASDEDDPTAYPSIFTRVSWFMNWISRTMKDT